MMDEECVNSINDLELHTWTSFVEVVKNFFKNRRAEIYKVVEKCWKVNKT